MYTITQDKKNIDGVVKTTYGIKCGGINRQAEQIRIVTLSFARCD